MTRINSAIRPAELCDKHLVAEYREIPRIASLAWQRFEKFGGLPPRGPTSFTLGKGHMMFFTYLGKFCSDRFLELVAEMKARGFKPAFETYREHPPGMHGNHSPTKTERTLLEERIKLRMPKNAKFTISWQLTKRT